MVLIAAVFKTCKTAAADPRVELSMRYSTLFYELTEEKKAFYYNAIYLVHKMLLSLSIALPDDTDIRIWASLVIQFLVSPFCSLTFNSSSLTLPEPDLSR